MLRARLATALVAIPSLLLLIFAAPPWALASVVVLIAIQGVVEFASMAFASQPGQKAFTIFLGAVVAIATVGGPQTASAGFAFVICAGLTWTLFARPDFERGLADLGLSVLGVFYSGFLLIHFVWFHRLEHGGEWITFILMTLMMGDSFGYFVGHAVGKHKLIERVSPGKTVEGSIGIMAGSLLAGLVGYWWPYSYIGCGEKFLGLSEALLAAAAMGVLGQVGDLGESIMKRTFGVKESGALLPGHGGVLDRIDSLLIPVAALYYFCVLVR